MNEHTELLFLDAPVVCAVRVRARISRAASLSVSREEETGRSSFRSSDNFLHSLSSFPRQALAIASHIVDQDSAPATCVSFSSVGRPIVEPNSIS